MGLERKHKAATGKLVVLKITTRDENDATIPPVFTVSEKGADGKYHRRAGEKGTTTFCEGNLVKLEVKEQEWKGDKYNTVAIYLADGEELYLIDARVNMLTRSLFNALLSLKTFEKVSISLYTFKKNDKKTNQPVEYPAVSVWQDNEQVKWLVPIADQPKPSSITFKGKIQNDYTDVDNFFIAKLRDFSLVVDAAAKSRPAKTPVAAAAPADEQPDDSAAPGDSGDGAPF